MFARLPVPCLFINVMVPPLSALSLALCHKHKPLSSNTIFPSYVHQPTVRYEPLKYAFQ